jgi:hypothetical protein
MEDLVFDEMIGRWVSPAEYEEFIEAMMDDELNDNEQNERNSYDMLINIVVYWCVIVSQQYH